VGSCSRPEDEEDVHAEGGSEAEVALSEAEVALSEAEVALWKDELWKAEVALSTGAGTCGRADTTEHGGNDEARRRQYA
jgi:hypothetical protein